MKPININIVVNGKTRYFPHLQFIPREGEKIRLSDGQRVIVTDVEYCNRGYEVDIKCKEILSVGGEILPE